MIRLLLSLLLTLAAWGADASLAFFHLSDTHIVNLKGADPRFGAALEMKKESSAHLANALTALAKEPQIGFVLITGDLIEGYSFAGAEGGRVYGQIEAFQKLLGASALPVYLTLGNHCLTSYRMGPEKVMADQKAASAARKAWGDAMAVFRDGTYYSFSKHVGTRTYRFLMLDDGEAVGLDPAWAVRQAAWVKAQIAEHARETVIVALHIPLNAAPYRKELEAAIGAAPNVALVLAGHKHTNGIEDLEIGGRKIPQVRTAALFVNEGNRRRVRLLEGSIEVSETGMPEKVERVIPVGR